MRGPAISRFGAPSVRRPFASIPTIGVDPGTKTTGVISLAGNGDILAGSLISWADQDTAMSHADEIIECVNDYTASWDKPGRVHLEDVVAPSGHLGYIDPGPVIELARLIGFLLGVERPSPLQWHLIAPGGNGSNPLATYPSRLINDGEKVGTGKYRHLRSAYDVALGLPSL